MRSIPTSSTKRHWRVGARSNHRAEQGPLRPGANAHIASREVERVLEPVRSLRTRAFRLIHRPSNASARASCSAFDSFAFFCFRPPTQLRIGTEGALPTGGWLYPYLVQSCTRIIVSRARPCRPAAPATAFREAKSAKER